MLLEKFKRRPLEVEAIQVTIDNIYDIAKWCNGEVHKTGKKFILTNGSSTEEMYVKVDVKNPVGERQTQAFVDDWVCKLGRGFKVFTKQGFEVTFEKV